MNITRHNYEEFFILYLDNELSAEQRRDVETFAAAHPDLKAELELLQQTQLQPDPTIQFAGKESLLQTEKGSIGEANYEEWLLSYIDNELTADERKEVEDFAIAHPSVQRELALLQSTRLQADVSVVYPDKASLYRYEEKAKVIGFPWKRVAVAAALLLAVGSTAFFIAKNKNGNAEDDNLATNTGINSASPVTKKSADEAGEQTNTTALSNPDVAGTSGESAVNDVEKNSANKNTSATVTTTGKDAVTSRDGKTIIEKANEEKLTATKTNNLPEPRYNPNVVNTTEEERMYAKLEPPTREGLTDPKQINQLPLVTPANLEPSLIRQSVTEPAENDVTYAAQPARKNKLRGFFRKVTRTFEKNTNIKATDEEDRLLIGGLAIRL